ncbi:MAG TPA: hemolysin family protein, partial [Gemmatimonadaceae bacterium]|nr:hemolysin family protein [Gemmatimonadaceae bacterium]
VLGRLLAIILLVLLNAFFVGAEFALVRSRRTRLEAMTRSGDKLARFAVRASSNISRILSASQLGVTLASLGLGWVAESTVGDVFASMFENLPFAMEMSVRLTLGATLAIIVVTYLHVVFGELTPKAAALNHPEALARWLAPPLLFFAWITTPFTYFLNKSSQVILRALGQEKAGSEEAVHSPEEIRLLVEQSQESGQMQAHDADLIDAVFEFSEKNAREVMTPRTELVALPVEATLSEVLSVVQESGLSRYPVYDESIDNIIGVVLAKDLLKLLAPRANTDAFDLPSIMRPVHVIPGSREVEEVLADFKRLKEHLAVVLDEYGGTAGVVTMEDLLEEIVGEILDEYDTPEDAEAPLHTRAGETLVPGSTHIGELNEHFSLTVPDEDYTTIGGYVFGVLGRLPVVGDRVIAGGAIFTVREMDGRRIETLAVDLHSLGDRRTAERETQSTHTEA